VRVRCPRLSMSTSGYKRPRSASLAVKERTLVSPHKQKRTACAVQQALSACVKHACARAQAAVQTSRQPLGVRLETVLPDMSTYACCINSPVDCEALGNSVVFHAVRAVRHGGCDHWCPALQLMHAAAVLGHATVVTAVMDALDETTVAAQIVLQDALLTAGNCGHFHVVDAMLQCSGKVRLSRRDLAFKVCCYGDTALCAHLATRAAPLLTTVDGTDFLQLVVESGRTVTLAALLQIPGARRRAIPWYVSHAAKRGLLDVMETLMQHCAIEQSYSPLDARDVLLAAVQGYQWGVTLRLLQSTAWPEIQTAVTQSTLHVACDEGKLAVVHATMGILRERGVDVDVHAAVQHASIAPTAQVLQYLLDSARGHTVQWSIVGAAALTDAVHYGRADNVRLLLSVAGMCAVDTASAEAALLENMALGKNYLSTVQVARVLLEMRPHTVRFLHHRPDWVHRLLRLSVGTPLKAPKAWLVALVPSLPPCSDTTTLVRMLRNSAWARRRCAVLCFSRVRPSLNSLQRLKCLSF